MNSKLEKSFEEDKEKYSKYNIDVESALKNLSKKKISLHCWQGDDLGGFEKPGSTLAGGGIQVTGNYFGRARSISELRNDLVKTLSLIPGKHKVNLHSIYGDFKGKKVERNQIEIEHFESWVEWAKGNSIGLDFNPTLFSHPKAESGFTLSSKNIETRKFWIEHVKRCREIGAYFGKELGEPCIHNLWIPDGMKDLCVDKAGYRTILKDSLDEIYSESYNVSYLKDSVESKLFGIGSESYVVGSHEFYLGYALTRNLMLCYDMGHFHPTESVADKISSTLIFCDEMLLHVSRGVRWDSDHVVISNDHLLDVMHEIVRANALNRVNLALDYFDGSINRIGAWVIGARATLKALLAALLEPTKDLIEIEEEQDYFVRLAYLEGLKTMPLDTIWEYYCRSMCTPYGNNWISEVRQYEEEYLGKRT